MRGIFRQFRALAHFDKLRFGAVVVLVPFLKIYLLSFGFKKTVALLKRFPGRRRTENENQLGRYRDLLKLCYRIFPVDGLCLPVSLTFWWMLRRKGIKTNLFFGTNKNGANLSAHAWIEYEGIPFATDRNINKKYNCLEIPTG